MPTLISTNSLSGTISVNNDTVTVAPGVYVYEDLGTAINLMGDGESKLINFGTIFGDTSNSTLDFDAHDSILVNHGLISNSGSGSNSAAILLSMDASPTPGSIGEAVVVNHGTITSTKEFFDIFGVGTNFNLTVENTGTMSSSVSSAFTTVVGVMQDARIVNSGTIIGGSAQFDGDVSTFISNSGLIEWRTLDLNATSGFVLRNTGELLVGDGAAIPTSLGSNTDDVVFNSGTLRMYLNLLDGSDAVTNSGTIIGSIDAEDGADIVTNRGDITNAVLLGADDDIYVGGVTSSVRLGIDGGSGEDTITGGGENDLIFGGSDGDVLSGGGGDDTIEGQDGTDEVYGGTGADLITGGADVDALNGGDGDDTVFGDSGQDLIRGGDGEDVLFGGTEDDFLFGGNDDDELRGDQGADFLNGGAGGDLLFGSVGEDTIIGGAGDDDVLGGADADDILGGSGADTLDGGSGVDSLGGGSGDDVLRGDDDNDVLRGGSGDDLMDGGAGRDRMFGDGGADVFVYDDVSDSALGAVDKIYNFRSGEDLINIDALSGTDFEFAGTGGHLGGGTASVRYVTTSLGVSVRVDADGNGSSDMFVLMLGTGSLTSEDFVL